MKPNSFWLVNYECRLAVVTISPDGKGFFAAGQEPLWDFSAVTEWIREIDTTPNVEEYYVIKSGVNGKYAMDVVPDVYRDVNYVFLAELIVADRFADFDRAAKAVDEIDPSECPIIQKVRRVTSVEVIE